MLAYKLKQEEKRRYIRVLRNEQGDEKSGLEDLKGIVKIFYSKLYSRQVIEPDTIKNYLSNNSNIKKLNEKQKKTLNQAITMAEISQAIKKQKKNKSPGPDGLPSEFYLAFEDEVCLIYKMVLADISEKKVIPESWNSALISLIHKKDSDEKEI